MFLPNNRRFAVPPSRHVPPHRCTAVQPRRRAAVTPRICSTAPPRHSTPCVCCPGYVDGSLTINNVSARLPSSVLWNHPRGIKPAYSLVRAGHPRRAATGDLKGGWGDMPRKGNAPRGNKNKKIVHSVCCFGSGLCQSGSMVFPFVCPSQARPPREHQQKAFLLQQKGNGRLSIDF